MWRHNDVRRTARMWGLSLDHFQKLDDKLENILKNTLHNVCNLASSHALSSSQPEVVQKSLQKTILKTESSFQFSNAVGASSTHFRLNISPRKKVWTCQFRGNLLAKDRRRTKKLSSLIIHCVPNISGYRTAESDLQDKKCTIQYGAANHRARKALTSSAECDFFSPLLNSP